MTVGTTVWAVLEPLGNRLHELAPHVATEAARLAKKAGTRAVGILVGTYGSEGLGELAGLGLETVLSLPSTWTVTAEVAAALVAAALSSTDAKEHSAGWVITAATGWGSEMAARLAAAADGVLITDCVDVEKDGSGWRARKTAYGGRVHQLCRWPEGLKLATFTRQTLETVRMAGPAPRFETLDLPAAAPQVRLLDRYTLAWNELDVKEASVVVSVGNGIAGAHTLPVIEELAAHLGAALGGTKMVVDAGLLPKSRQIGASGKWIEADLYIALGISGATHHMMGLQGVKKLIAINTDEKAPIFRKADLAVVADLHVVVPELNARLQGERHGEAATVAGGKGLAGSGIHATDTGSFHTPV